MIGGRPKRIADLDVFDNPAREGGEVTIVGSPNGTVYVGVTGKTPVEVKLNAEGEATVPVPVQAGEEFVVTDMEFPLRLTVERVSIDELHFPLSRPACRCVSNPQASRHVLP